MQILLVPFDVANSWVDAGYDMVTYWKVVYLMVALYLAVCPVFLVFYETNEDI